MIHGLVEHPDYMLGYAYNAASARANVRAHYPDVTCRECRTTGKPIHDYGLRYCGHCGARIDTHPTARANVPDFVPSLRLLVERERYSWTDIGMMFGVSRERPRQWARAYGIVHPDDARRCRGTRMVRVWDDALHRFVPQTKRSVQDGRIAARRARRVWLRAERHAHIVEMARRLASNGALSWKALAGALGCDSDKQALPYLLGRWLAPSSRAPSVARAADLRATLLAAGVRVRERGEHLRGPHYAKKSDLTSGTRVPKVEP